MVKAVIETDHYLTRLSAGSHQWISDESLINGGHAKGPAPMDLLASSLASCTCITLRMYADRKQWHTGTIEVEVSIEKELHIEATRFERKIAFSENLSDEKMEKLLDIANHCPVHKLLSKTILINTTV
jgi:putative redox protein